MMSVFVAAPFLWNCLTFSCYKSVENITQFRRHLQVDLYSVVCRLRFLVYLSTFMVTTLLLVIAFAIDKPFVFCVLLGLISKDLSLREGSVVL